MNECSQLCVNEPGSYHCDCEVGYTLSEDLSTCLGKKKDKSAHSNNSHALLKERIWQL